MLDKIRVFEVLREEVRARLLSLEKTLESSRLEMVSESKSTAGDKHETGRAMAQLEQEKLGRQVLSARELVQAVEQINPAEKYTEIRYGSLVKMSTGWFFFSVGIGKLEVDSESVFCLTMASPLGIALKGKKVGNTVVFNGRTIEVEKIG